MSKETKNQHHIPQFYLRRFSDEKQRICVYDIKKDIILRNQNPRNYAAVRFFYDVTKKELKEIMREMVAFKPELEYQIDYDDDQFIEHYFSKSEFETQKIMDILDNEPHRLLEEEIKQKMISFLYDLSIRTELIRKQFEYIGKKQNELAENMGIQQLIVDATNGAKITQLKSLFSIEKLYEKATMLECGYDWYIGNNVSELNFITTDNPLQNLFAGFNDICFPITKRKAIILRAKNHGGNLISKDVTKDGIRIDISRRSAFLYNSYLIGTGYRYAFGDEKTFEMMEGINQILNAQPYPQRPF